MADHPASTAAPAHGRPPDVKRTDMWGSRLGETGGVLDEGAEA